MNYESTVKKKSKAIPGVEYTIRKISFMRRLELSQEIRAIAGQLEFSQAGTSFSDQVDASILSLEVDRTYLKWGLVHVDGLNIDGQPAVPESLIDHGPENLCHEISQAIRSECGLTEEERKN